MVGIMIRFNARGQAAQFDLQATLNVVVQGVVFLPMWTGIVVMIGRYLLGVRSKMYDAAIKETLEYDEEIAKFAATAIIAAQIFNSAKTDASEKGLTADDLQKVFDAAPGVPEHIARKLAEEVIKGADAKKKQGDGNGFVTLPELTDVLTGNVCSWKRMSMAMEADHGSAKVLPSNPAAKQQQQAPTPQAPTPQGNVVQAVCPPGVSPGQMMQVAMPDGRSIQCAVPAGVQPGQQFTIEVPAQQQTPTGSLLTVTCPQGAGPGQAIQVQGPGGLINVTIPPGVQPGQQFQVRV